MPFLHWKGSSTREVYTKLSEITEVVVVRDEEGTIIKLHLSGLFDSSTIGGTIDDPIEAKRVFMLLKTSAPDLFLGDTVIG